MGCFAKKKSSALDGLEAILGKFETATCPKSPKSHPPRHSQFSDLPQAHHSSSQSPFDQQTHHGVEMSFYNDLLQKAIDSITKTFKHRLLNSLFNSGKGAIMPEHQKQVSSKTDFNLITWLVIKDE